MQHTAGTNTGIFLQTMRCNSMEVHLNARVRQVMPQGVKTEPGEWYRGGNVICTIGVVPNPLLQSLDLLFPRDTIN
ncbi:MAG: hypothetical protein PVH54_00565 [Gammaproteobacteria bacterium]|jgi:hypothetical protein